MKVYQRGKRGLYWIYFSSGGRIIRESAGTTDRRLAERYLAKRFGEEASGSPRAGPEITVGEAVALWEESLASPLSLHQRNLSCKLRIFLQWLGPTRKLSHVTSRVVVAWVEERNKGRAPETVHKDIGALRSLFAWAVGRGFAETNPATAVVAPAIRRVRRHGLSIEQVRDVLEKVQGSVLEPVYLLAFFQGLRRGEIARSRFEDADMKAGTLFVRGLKTENSEGTLPIHPLVRTWLAEHWQDSGPIVANRRGSHYHPASLENLRVECKRSGNPSRGAWLRRSRSQSCDRTSERSERAVGVGWCWSMRVAG